MSGVWKFLICRIPSSTTAIVTCALRVVFILIFCLVLERDLSTATISTGNLVSSSSTLTEAKPCATVSGKLELSKGRISVAVMKAFGKCSLPTEKLNAADLLSVSK